MMHSKKITRRTIAQMLAAGAAATSVPGWASGTPEASSPLASPANQGFPAGFLWGSATASYQVEGAVHEGGRGSSVWDTFSHTPGKVDAGDTGDVADDFYHRYRDDIAMMKRMGLKTFRFSLSWSRIFPNGTGQPNQAGLDFYSRLVDALLAADIAPFCTLYHWDTPQKLQDAGGWENPDTGKAFAEYAGFAASKLSDRVQHFMTMNEMKTFVELGYGSGTHAPGLRVGNKRLAQLRHYVVLAHGRAMQAVRANSRPGTKVGLADNMTVSTPVVSSPEHIAAARKAMRELNAGYLSVVMDGRYTDHYLKSLGADAPHFTAQELKIISTPMDFLGLNIYTPTWVCAADNPEGFAAVSDPASYPHMQSPWLTIGPEAMYWGPRLVHDVWSPKEMYITENGASSDDKVAANGEVYDTDRTMYLRNYLMYLQRAVADGVPVRGYFLWSLLDNFEWADGYGKRFGIVYVDFKSQVRTLKLSAKFYEEVIRTNRVA